MPCSLALPLVEQLEQVSRLIGIRGTAPRSQDRSRASRRHPPSDAPTRSPEQESPMPPARERGRRVSLGLRAGYAAESNRLSDGYAVSRGRSEGATIRIAQHRFAASRVVFFRAIDRSKLRIIEMHAADHSRRRPATPAPSLSSVRSRSPNVPRTRRPRFANDPGPASRNHRVFRDAARHRPRTTGEAVIACDVRGSCPSTGHETTRGVPCGNIGTTFPQVPAARAPTCCWTTRPVGPTTSSAESRPSPTPVESVEPTFVATVLGRVDEGPRSIERERRKAPAAGAHAAIGRDLLFHGQRRRREAGRDLGVGLAPRPQGPSGDDRHVKLVSVSSDHFVCLRRTRRHLIVTAPSAIRPFRRSVCVAHCRAHSEKLLELSKERSGRCTTMQSLSAPGSEDPRSRINSRARVTGCSCSSARRSSGTGCAARTSCRGASPPRGASASTTT